MTKERWEKLSLVGQLANIGSEVYRAITWFRKNEPKDFQLAFERALELFDLTIEDKRWKHRLKEICRAREVFCTLLTDPGNIPNLDKELDSLDKYFMYFAVLARYSA